MTAAGLTVVRTTSRHQFEWDRFVERHGQAEAYHAYGWREVLEAGLGQSCHYVHVLDERGAFRGVLPLVHLSSRLFGNFLVSVPYFNYCGILASDTSAALALVNAANTLGQEFGASHVELRHRGTMELDLPSRDDKVAMRLPLPDSIDSLWQRFRPKLRAQIRRPTKEGASNVSGGAELIDEFYAVFSRNMRDLGTPVFPKSLFREMCRQFPDDVNIHVVRLGDEPVAAGVTVAYRDVMEIPSASSLRDYNRFSVNMLLYWSVLQFAIERGCRIFDFGRSSVDAGTFRFKRQWGAEPQPLRWHYALLKGTAIPRLNPENPKFRLAARAWSRLPLPVANFVGPRIVRHLP